MRFFIYFLAISLGFSTFSCKQNYQEVVANNVPLELNLQSDHWQSTPVTTFLKTQSSQSIPTTFRISKEAVLSILSVNPAQRVNFRLGLDEQNQMLLSTVGQMGLLNATPLSDLTQENNWTRALSNQDWNTINEALHYEGEQLRSFSFERTLLESYVSEKHFSFIDLILDIEENILSITAIGKTIKGHEIPTNISKDDKPCPIHCDGMHP